MDSSYVGTFDRQILGLFQNALKLGVRDPRMMAFLYRANRWQKRAVQVRAKWEEQGVHVPPFVIASVTRRCNLHCKGCYARAQQRSQEPELTPAQLRGILAEARELGVSIVLLAGGEPLTRPGILDICADCPEITFPLFTNGLLIDDEMIARFRRQRNIVPVISLEGLQSQTDDRRGDGVYQHLLGIMRKLKEQGIFFGTSLTVTRLNYETVYSREYMQERIDAGSQLFFFVEYVPVQPGTEPLVLTDEQREGQSQRLAQFRQELPGLFVALPGDEEQFGGCLAAGRGFIHISPEGRLEPCPFAPYSDTSLKTMSLREALQSEFLKQIRGSSHHLTETQGGCALWAQRDWVQSLLSTPEMVG